MSIISADQLCTATESILRAALPEVLALAPVQAYLGDQAGSYWPIKTWQQLPTIEALAAADLPGIAITSPGLVEPPRYVRSKQLWEATFRVAVGVYERGRDHADTQARVRNYCGFIRAAMQRNQTLGGVARSVDWRGEEYALRGNREAARTLAAGAVAFDVAAEVDNTLVLGLTPVTSSHPALSVE